MSVGFLSVAVADEQAAAEQLRLFLVDTIGWGVAEDVTDTATDRDVVFMSTGEGDSANGFTRYIRIRGTGNALVLYTYETFISTLSNTGEVSDATYGLVTVPDDGRGFLLQAVADLERVVLHVETYAGTRYMGYVGRIKSYSTASQRPYPNLVKGGQSTSYGWYYSALERNSWMRGADSTQAHYYAVEPVNATGLNAGGPNDRNGDVFLSAPVIVRADADTSKSELAGEPRGVYRLPGGVAQHNAFFTIDMDTYVVFETNSEMMAVGPVTVSGTGELSLYTSSV